MKGKNFTGSCDPTSIIIILKTGLHVKTIITQHCCKHMTMDKKKTHLVVKLIKKKNLNTTK